MRRRQFTALLGAAAAWPLTARAQQAVMPVIGFLQIGSPVPDFPPFERGLAEHGYVFGKNVTKEARWAQGNHDKLPELASELVSLNPTLIVTPGNVVAVAVRRATSTIPIVFVIASDPTKIGLARASLIPEATPPACPCKRQRSHSSGLSSSVNSSHHTRPWVSW